MLIAQNTIKCKIDATQVLSQAGKSLNRMWEKASHAEDRRGAVGASLTLLGFENRPTGKGRSILSTVLSNVHVNELVAGLRHTKPNEVSAPTHQVAATVILVSKI